MDVLHPQLRSHEEDGRPWPVLVWHRVEPLKVISSAPYGGGWGVCSWVINAQVPLSYSRHDPHVGLEDLVTSLGLVGPGVGMLTAADVAGVQYAQDSEASGAGVEVAATVGLRVPTWAAAASSEPGEGITPGATITPVDTINIVAFVPQRLSDAALVNAVATATEAKSQALWDAGIDATGTATDAVCICCPEEGTASPFGGPRSPWGERLARAVHSAVGAGARTWSAGPSS